MKTIIASIAVLLLFALFGAMAALANPYDGNPLDWCPTEEPQCQVPQYEGIQFALRQSRIGSGSVDGKTTWVCSYSWEFPNSTQAAVFSWNAQLTAANQWYTPKTGPAAFQWYPDCDASTDVWVTTQDFYELCPERNGRRPHACTYPRSRDYEEHSLGYTQIALNPEKFGGSPYSDGDQHTNRDIAHELGHSF